MSWFFSSPGPAAPAEPPAPQSPASAAAAAFGAAAKDERVQQSAREFLEDPGVQVAAKDFVSDQRVQTAALKSVGLGGAVDSPLDHQSAQPSGLASRSASTPQRVTRVPTRRNSADETAVIAAFAPAVDAASDAEMETRLVSGAKEEKVEREEEDGKDNDEKLGWFDRIQMSIPGVADDSAFAQQLRLYALAGNLERECSEVQEELRRKSVKRGRTLGNDPTLVDLFQNLLVHSKMEAQDRVSSSNLSFDQVQYAEQGRLADLMVQRIGLAADEEERAMAVRESR